MFQIFFTTCADSSTDIYIFRIYVSGVRLKFLTSLLVNWTNMTKIWLAVKISRKKMANSRIRIFQTKMVTN